MTEYKSQKPTLEEMIEDIVAHCPGLPSRVKRVMIAHLKDAIASELNEYCKEIKSMNCVLAIDALEKRFGSLLKEGESRID